MKIVLLAITLIGIAMAFILPHVDVIRQSDRVGKNITDIKKNVKRTTMLHKIVQEGNIEDIKKVISRGTPIDIQNPNGHTALHLAASLSRYDVVKLLIEKGANPNIKDNKGDRPIDLVAKIPPNDKIINFLNNAATKHKD